MTLEFASDDLELKLIKALARRGVEYAKREKLDPKHPLRDRLSRHMDISACHASGNPLRLQAFLEADDFNFLHDIMGIARHLNRETGQLENCFLPRFTDHSKDEAAA